MKTCVKAIVLSAMSVLVVFTGITYTSCNPDKCKAITCAYGGTCTDGECTCATGYEGNQCEKISRDKFTGVWDVVESGTLTGSNQYATSIFDAEAIQDVAIGDFYNYFPTHINAYVSADTLYIPRQEVFNRIVEGIGYMNPSLEHQEYGHMIVRYYVTEVTTGKTNDFGWDQGEPSHWYKTSE